ncbi:gluconate:H+ symporter [Novosphingobium sp.]|jgi:GntP family gluconate:H+ symporter|uniref:GntT/GntP/DsdX family permease n=1 Tax=Novosphingobium sp. TaxID=1874826 RepID=UPI0031D68573
MMTEDMRLILSAVLGIAAAITLIVKARFHPFLALLCGAFLIGLLTGLPPAELAHAVEKGAGDVLGGTGLVVALGLSLGAMLQLSNGAEAVAQAGLRVSGPRAAPWMSMAVALLLGLPLFFETGLVLLLPIVAAAADGLSGGKDTSTMRLRLMLPALAGLSTLHALVPPHPGPLLAVTALHANLGLTMFYGLLVGLPTAIIAGPLLAGIIARHVHPSAPVIGKAEPLVQAPGLSASLIAVLLPVVLIALGQVKAVVPPAMAAHLGWTGLVSNPVFALVLANLAAMPLLFGRRMCAAPVQGAIWAEAMKPAGAIILAIGAGGALKQVLVTAGLADFLAHLASHGGIPAIPMAWMTAVCIRLATGSATVATITAAGIMPAVVTATGASPEWTVLAIGAGSIFFSHVNDPGFWLVRSYLGTSTPDTFRSWSAMETVVSVVALAFVLAGSYLL